MERDLNSILSYLEHLSMNNERDRFHEEKNQKRYQESRKDFVWIVEHLYEKIWIFDKTLPWVETKNMIFRINRDVRFSKDKSPYKNNFWASMTRDWWKKSPYSWYYFHLQPWNHSFIAWWLHWPDKEIVDGLRLQLEYHWDKFNKVITNKKFKKEYGGLLWRSLVRPPRWYNQDTPYLNLIKMKDWYVVKYFKDSEVIQNNFLDSVLASAKILFPFNKCINNLLEDVIT